MLSVTTVKRKAVPIRGRSLWAGTDVTCHLNNLINDQKSWEKRVAIMVSPWASDCLHPEYELVMLLTLKYHTIKQTMDEEAQN